MARKRARHRDQHKADKMVKNNSERIQQLEDTIQQLQKKIEQQETGMAELRSYITDQNEKYEQQITALRQLINDTDTKLTIETAKHERDMRSINNIRTEETAQRTNNIDITMPNFSGEDNEHPKMFLKNLETYLKHKKVMTVDRIIVIENCLKGKAATWFSTIKDTTPTEETFKQLFLKHFFSEDKQWNIFIKCTEAGKKPITNNFQEHFHIWMAELKYLDSPKLNEEQAINLITKHFPVAIQAYIQTTREKNFLNIWEKLGELENSHNKQIDYDRQNDQNTVNLTKQTHPNNQAQQFTNRYGRNNQTQQFDNRYNTQQQPRNSSYRQGQSNATQQTRQPIGNNQTPYQSSTRQTAGANTQQNQYTPKAVKHLAIYNDEDETYEENYFEAEKDNESKNQERGTMNLDQPLS